MNLCRIIKKRIMKTLKMTLLLFFVLGMTSCLNDSQPQTNTPNHEFKNMTVKEILESGVSINATMKELEDMEKEAVSRSGQDERPLWAIPAYRAAHYRFVTHAKQDEKGTVTWTAKCGADLNISDDLFNAFVNDFKFQNDFVQKNLREGTKYTPTWIDEEYKNNILSEEFVNSRLKELKELKQQMESGEFKVLNQK